MSNTHIDMEEEIKELVAKREGDVVYKAVIDGDAAAQARLRQERSTTLIINPNRDVPFETRQVESFLRFMSEGLENEMESAEMDNIVYDGLGNHRILGKKKKKKKKMGY